MTMMEKERVVKELQLQLNRVIYNKVVEQNSEQEDEIRELCELSESQEKELCRLQQEMEQPEKQLSALVDEKSMLSIELSQLTSALNEYKEKNHALETQVEILKQESSNSAREIARDRASLSSKFEEKTLECNNLKQELMFLTDKIQILESEVSQIYQQQLVTCFCCQPYAPHNL
jgi:chromosome segregation ATPase